MHTLYVKCRLHFWVAALPAGIGLAAGAAGDAGGAKFGIPTR